MRRVLTGVILGVLGIWLSPVPGPCYAGDTGRGEASVALSLLVYRVSEPPGEPYVERILVSPRYLRLDQGENGDGFVLLERSEGVVYSVSPEEQTILVIDPRVSEVEPPPGLELSEERREQPDSPKIQGALPLELRFLANGELCRSAVVVPGLMGDAVLALAQYYRVLALQQAEVVAAFPSEFRRPCDLASYVYAPGRELRHGLPVSVWDAGGTRRQLLDFDPAFSAPAASFRLPQGYRRLRVSDLAGGAVTR